MIPRLLEFIFKDRFGYVGRKLVAAWTLTTMSVAMVFSHLLFTYLVDREAEQLLASEDFVTLMIAIWGTFFTADTVNKWIYNVKYKNTGNSEQETPSSREDDEDSRGGSNEPS